MTNRSSKDNKAVNFVYFDIGNVLVDHSSVVRKVAEKYHLDISELAKVFSQHIKTLCRGEISQEDLSKIIRNEFNIDDENFNWVSFNNHELKPILPAHLLLEQISQHLPIGLLSDSWEGMPQYMFERGHVPKLNYSVEAYSHLVGSVKPEEKLMKYAEDRAGVEPSSILFVDDKETNVQGAINRGWQALVFDPASAENSTQSVRSYLTIHGLSLPPE